MFVSPRMYGLSFGIPNVPVDYIGENYEVDASVKYLDSFTIDSSKSLTLTIELVKGNFGVNYQLGNYSNAKSYGGFTFSPQ